jgi:hypothetical protein
VFGDPANDRVAITAFADLDEEMVDGRGQPDGLGAEMEREVAPVVDDLVDGPAGDAGQWLSEPQDEESRDTVDRVQCVVVQQPVHERPSVVGFDADCEELSWPRLQSHVGCVAVADGPGQEGPGVVVPPCLVSRPFVDGRLAAGRRRRPVFAQPTQQVHGGLDVGAHGVDLLVGDWRGQSA